MWPDRARTEGRPVRRSNALPAPATTAARGGIPQLASATLWAGALGAVLAGCASPGPPRPPSLFLPRPVTDLEARRVGEAVELRFTVPTLSTDGQPLRARELHGILCRQDSRGAPCQPVDRQETAHPLPIPGYGPSAPVIWTDVLPIPLLHGAPRPIAYRVELLTPSGGSAGFSDSVYAAAGTAPPPVTSFRASGNRLGVELRWTPVPGGGEVLLRRTERPSTKVADTPSPEVPVRSAAASEPEHSTHSSATKAASTAAKREPGPAAAGLVWLQAEPGSTSAAATLDNSIEPGVAYRYSALRRRTVQVGGHRLELDSQPSEPAEFTWRDTYSPPVPTELTALGYDVPGAEGQQPGYAVDLIWLPVEDKQLAGYLVYRQELGRGDNVRGIRGRLTPQPIPSPGFHDSSAQPGKHYRYSVSAVAANGSESPAVETVVPSP